MCRIVFSYAEYVVIFTWVFINFSQSRRKSVKYGVVLIRHGLMSCAGLSDLQPMVTAYFGTPVEEHEDSYKINLADGYITTQKT